MKYLYIPIIFIVMMSCVNDQQNKTKKSSEPEINTTVETPASKTESEEKRIPECILNINTDSLQICLDSTLSIVNNPSNRCYIVESLENFNIKNIDACKTYYSVANNSDIIKYPTTRYDENYIIIDKLNVLDKVTVPLFNGTPLIVLLPYEVCDERAILCIHNNQYCFARYRDIVDNRDIKAIHNNRYKVFDGNNILILRMSDSSYYAFEKRTCDINQNYSWSEDKRMVTYSVTSDDKEVEVFLTDLFSWTDTFIDEGDLPQIVDSTNIIYYKSMGKNSFKFKSINYYNITDKKIYELYQMPDSLELTGYGVDQFMYSEIKKDKYSDTDCFSVILHKGKYESDNHKQYKLFFSLSDSASILGLEELKRY
ncbi:MAG: hypothetical protein N4A72_02255 [Bacteroidales bacterium]|nr:hypothetical protein [Bacteroidales bacterium]